MSALFRFTPLLALFPLVSCGQDEQAAAPPPRPVLAMKVVSALDSSAGFAGTVAARYQTTRGFQVLGMIETLDVDVGDLVTKGQQLAELDRSSFQLDVNAREGDVTKAKARVDNATTTVARTRQLLASNTSTPAQLEADEQALAAAKASLDQANAELVKAHTRLDYTKLVSDENGVIVSKEADAGQTVSAGQPVLTIARTDAREVVVDVPEPIAAALKLGAPFDIFLQVDPAIAVKGRVREIAPQSDEATRTRRVRIAMENPPEPFRLGTTVTAKPSGAVDAPTVLKIPRAAVVEAGGKTSVWVVDAKEQTVHSKDVIIDKPSDREVQISSGLSAGEFVVTAGVSDLKDGQKVVFGEGDVR